MDPGLLARATCTRLASPAAPPAAAFWRLTRAIWSRSIVGSSRCLRGRLEAAHGDRLEALFYVLAITAGLRQGELLCLK
jgi:hypothetical protein